MGDKDSFVHGTGEAIIKTDRAVGVVDVGTLYLGVNYANITGFIGAKDSIKAVEDIGLLNTISPGTHYFYNIDLFGLAQDAMVDDDLVQSILDSLLSNYNYGFGYDFLNLGTGGLDYMLLLEPLECEVAES
ncbi:MAG: hypothetical protein KKE11_01315 [Gammaproteobacteria bacterium]|nr:hypothetical protein [Gammaproteobacteria bacterium]